MLEILESSTHSESCWCDDYSLFRKPDKSGSTGEVHVVGADAEVAILVKEISILDYNSDCQLILGIIH